MHGALVAKHPPGVLVVVLLVTTAAGLIVVDLDASPGFPVEVTPPAGELVEVPFGDNVLLGGLVVEVELDGDFVDLMVVELLEATVVLVVAGDLVVVVLEG